MALTWPVGATPPGMDATTVKRIRYPKSPLDLTPVTGDFRGALSAIDCDTLDPSFTPLVNVVRNDGGSADLYAVGTPNINADGTRVTVWIAAGSVGFEYLVSITVQSNDGQEITRSFIFPVGIR
jgi:hypothetical protein